MKILHFLFLFFFTSYAMAKYLPLQLDHNAYLVTRSSPTTPILMILFLITLLIGKIFILYPRHQIHSAQDLLNLSLLKPQTAFVFDLHGVIFRFDPILAITAAIHAPSKKLLLKTVLNPWIIWDVIKLLHNSAVVEEAIMAIGYKYPNLKAIIPTALKIANAQSPIWPTMQLIKQIKRNGFKLYIFSNIGEQSASILQAKYPEIFALFDGILVTESQDNYIMKPSQASFNKFLNKFNLEKQQIIFIDDKQSNIHIARTMGIAAIQFINPCQCAQLLQKIVPLPN